MSVVFAEITETPIHVAACEAAVGDASHGAVVGFAGVVRDHDGGSSVSALSYEAHPDAEKALRAACELIAARYPAVTLAARHRVGALRIGDTALACAAGSAHRPDAFSACRDLVDEIKATVPIWKEQHFADGTTEWVGSL